RSGSRTFFLPCSSRASIHGTVPAVPRPSFPQPTSAMRGWGSSASTSRRSCSTMDGEWLRPRRLSEFSGPISIGRGDNLGFPSRAPLSNVRTRDERNSCMTPLISLLFAALLAQQPPAAAAAPPQRPDPVATAAPARYLIGPQDLLKITVFDEA